MFNKAKLKQALNNNFLKASIDETICAAQVLIDSRQKSNNGLFIALIGDNNDGHNYLKQAFDNGAIMAIVQKTPETFQNDPRLILVKDVNQSLLDLATYARSVFKGKLIGITGSVGKTSIKEMLKTVLSFKNKVFATPGNLNNHFGLPLSLCNLPENHDYAILEMGMSNLGEIEFLSKIAKPHIAIISNISAAHIGNFNNEQEIASAKSEIFLGLEKEGHIIINQDNKYYDFLISQAAKSNIDESNIVSFSQNHNSNIKLESFENKSLKNSQVNITINGEPLAYNVNSINEAVISNSLISIAVLKILKENINDYLPAFSDLSIPAGRGDVIKISHENKSLTIINDSYNANLTSVISGIKFLANLGKQSPVSRTIAIIGDMLDLGDQAAKEHEAIAYYIEKYEIDKILLVGKLTKSILSKISPDKFIGHFMDSNNLASDISKIVRNNDIVLIKGSRGTKMEVIIDKLKKDNA